ncbi:MAG: NB-ARC domain-containing protein [Ktedonobacteraceae bacterium]
MTWYLKLRHERKLRGWSQAYIAEMIGSDLKTVGRWEQGKAFPSPHFRQRLVELFGKNAEELELLEEVGSKGDTSGQVTKYINEDKPSQHIFWQKDWGEAPHIDSFYGRQKELTEVEQWIMGDHCRVIAVLGIGGVGKTTFATMLAEQVKNSFDYVFWRSLQNAPSVESIAASFLQFVSNQRRMNLPKDLDGQISQLITSLREHPCLLILDNVEPVLQAGKRAGQYLAGYEGYGRLFQRIGEAYHQSCLLLTSREKPKEIARMEGNTSPVRSLLLPGMELADGQKLLEDKDLFGSDEIWATLVHLYSGNPLALKLISEPIRELFGGDIASFLREEKTVFGDIQDLLDPPFHRLSGLEQEIMFWLAIEREAVTLNAIQANILHPVSKGAILAVFDSLRRRSMIETRGDGRFTLQPVITEYVTERFVERVCREIETETIELFGSHALIKADSNDYVRDSQIRLILAPVAERLLATFRREEIEKKFKRILATLRTLHPSQSSYAAGNLLNLLVYLHSDLRGSDFSHLTVRQAYLQGVALPEVNFTYSDLAASVFTDTFSNILCVALSPNGELLAAGTTTVEVRLWRADTVTPLFTCLGHADGVRSVAFSPDSSILASGSEDQTIRLWDTNTGDCLKVLHGHTSLVRSVAFSPDGKVLVSGSEDRTVRTWDVNTGLPLNIMEGHTHWVRSVAFSPGGRILASGSEDQTVCIWATNTHHCLKVLYGHMTPVRSIVFSPDGKVLASGSDDQTIRLWDTSSGDCLKVLHGHTDRVRSIAFTSNGQVLASSSDDQTIRLWDTNTGQCLKVLHGHTNRIWSIAFFPSDKVLVSASEDDTMRFWEVRIGQCLKTLQGYSASLIKSVAFSPDGQTLASGSEDQLIRLWEVSTSQCLKILQGHANRVRTVAFSPDGTTVASGSEDETVRIWDAHTGQGLKVLRGHTHLVRCVAFNADGSVLASASHDQTVRLWNAGTGECLMTLQGHNDLVWSVAFSPDSKVLASSSEDQTVRIWDAYTGQCLKVLQGHTHRVWSIAFSPTNSTIASSSDDQTVKIWDVRTGHCLKTVHGHSSWVRSVAFGPDGNIIASGSHDQTVRLWDAHTGQCLKTLHGHSSCIWSVAFSPVGSIVASGSDDGTIKLWNADTGECITTLRSDRPYELMNLAGAKGLTEAQKTSLKMLGAIEDK